MSKKENKKEITTMAVSIADNQRITQHCEALSIPKKDFIPIILDFIENNGINPKTDHAPKTELAQIKKRIDQYFGFIKTQEKEYLRPMLEAIQATENRLQNQINNLVVKDDIKGLMTVKFYNEVFRMIKTYFYRLIEITENSEFYVKKISDEMEADKKERLKFQEEVIERLEEIENQKWFKRKNKKK